MSDAGSRALDEQPKQPESSYVVSPVPTKMTPPALSEKHLDTLRHMLGINDPSVGRPKPYRDYAAVEPGDAQFLEMAVLGAVERYRCASSGFPYDYYRCADTGRAAAIASHKNIRWSKSKRVYGKFLVVRDALGDVSFKEFLTNPDFKECRDSA